MNRKEFQEISTTRLKEARALLDRGFYDGAYYLAGYSVECALKACIAKATKRFEFPDKKRVDASHPHNLRELLKIAGLEAARAQVQNVDEDFKVNMGPCSILVGTKPLPKAYSRISQRIASGNRR